MNTHPDEKKFEIVRGNEIVQIKNNEYKEILSIDFDDLSFKVEANIYQPFLSTVTLVEGIIGIYTYLDYHFLIVITSSTPIDNMNESSGSKKNNLINSIRKVKDTDFIALGNYSSIPPLLKKIISSMKALFANGFYFSNEYDLSNNLSSQFQTKKCLKNYAYDNILDADPKFLANYKFIDKFLERKLGESFISSCIYGYIGAINNLIVNYKSINLLLISRRYIRNFSIMQFYQGLNKCGDLSNQIEHELLIFYDFNKNVYSYLAITGKNPCYYREIKKSKLNSINISFKQYLNNLFEDYGIVSFFNAVNKDNKEDIDQKNKFKNFLKKYLLDDDTTNNYYTNTTSNFSEPPKKEEKEKEKDIKFKYFQFPYSNDQIKTDENNESNQNEVFQNFINDKKDIINLFNYTYKSNDTILKNQKGIISLNGNDFKVINDLLANLSIHILEKELKKIFSGNEQPEEPDNNEEDYESELSLKEISIEMYNQFNQLIANNYKELISQYDINQKEPKKEEKELREYQRILQILFFSRIELKSSYYYLNFFKPNFSKITNIYLYATTWNVNAMDIKKSKPNFEKLLLQQTNEISPDIYIIGVQEGVSLSVSNLILTQKDFNDLIKEWDVKILKTLSQINNSKYVILQEMNLVGIIFFVFIKESKVQYISDLRTNIIKTGLKGTYGNKGSCLISFSYFNTKIAFCCSHLAAGGKKNNQRVNELIDILDCKFKSANIGKIGGIIIESVNEEDVKNNVNLPKVLIVRKSVDVNPKEIEMMKLMIDNDMEDYRDDDFDNEEMVCHTSRAGREDISALLNTEPKENNEIKKVNSIRPKRQSFNSEDDNKLIQKNNINEIDTSDLSFFDNDIWFIIGDLNFRIDTNKDNNMDNIYSENFEELIKFDQLYKSINAIIELNDKINESKITFQPTYKFINGKNEYNLKRLPSWCDRILFKTYKDEKHQYIHPIDYNSMSDLSFSVSDHRPVYGIYKLDVMEDKPELKQVYENEIEENKNLGISSNYMRKKLFI